MDELIKKNSKENNYQEILSEILKKDRGNEISQILESICSNPKIEKKQKEEIYNKLFSYVERINKCFEKEIENIYIKGVKEACITQLIGNNIIGNKNTKSESNLEECLNDFIIKRLEMESKVKDNSNYKRILEEIKLEKEKINNVEKLEELYETKCDIEIIDSYQIGFKDAMKMLNKKNIM